MENQHWSVCGKWPDCVTNYKIDFFFLTKNTVLFQDDTLPSKSELPFSRNDASSLQLKEGQKKRNNSTSENSNYYWGYAMMKVTNLFWQERIELSKLNESTNTAWTSVLYHKCFSRWIMIKDIYCYAQLTNHFYVKHKWLKVSLKYIPLIFKKKNHSSENCFFSFSKTKEIIRWWS